MGTLCSCCDVEQQNKNGTVQNQCKFPSRLPVDTKKDANPHFNSSQKQTFRIARNLRNILFKPFQQSDGNNFKNIQSLAERWKPNNQSNWVFKSGDIFQQKHLYKSCLLTARVLRTVKQFFQTIKMSNSFNSSRDFQLIQKYMIENRLEIYHSRLLFTQKPIDCKLQEKMKAYIIENQQAYQNTQRLQRFYQYCKINSDFFTNLLTNLAKIDLITLKEVPIQIENEFMNMVENISQSQHKQMFVHNYSFYQLQNMKYSQQFNHQQKIKQILVQQIPNYMFYSGKHSMPSNMNIQQLHKKQKDYQFLEESHDYIQWMFPNHYSSGFNNQCFPLNYLQSKLFLFDKKVAKKLQKSLKIFLDFMGLRMGQSFQLITISEQRLINVILVYSHNHYRIMRLLACLSITGFRQIAQKIVEFLEYNTRQEKLLEKQRNKFEQSWKIYGKDEKQLAKKMCFLEYKQFPHHYF